MALQSRDGIARRPAWIENRAVVPRLLAADAPARQSLSVLSISK